MKLVFAFLLFLSALLSSSCDTEDLKNKVKKFGSQMQDKYGITDTEKNKIENLDPNGLAAGFGTISEGDCNKSENRVRDIASSENLDSIIMQSLSLDSSCNNVKTSWRDEETNQILNKEINPELRYKKVLANSFLNRICQSGEVFELLSSAPSMAKDSKGRFHDTAATNHLAFGAGTESGAQNVIASYAMLYSLGIKESSGEFLKGKDPGANNNLAHNKEAGLFQFSANSLNAGTKEGQVSKRKMFKTYLDRLSRLSPGDKATYCGVKLLDNNENQKVKTSLWHPEKIISNGIIYDTTGAKLDHDFNQSCKDHLDKDFSSISDKVVGICFQQMQKGCPNFAVDYGSIMVRTNRGHNGPLLSKTEWQSIHDSTKNERLKSRIKNSILPARSIQASCHVLFKNIYDNKESLCRGRN